MRKNRNSDAVSIQNGACNPSGICHSILNACDELREKKYGTKDITEDPAVRLMVHQLAFICKVGEIDHLPDKYTELMTKVSASKYTRTAPKGETKEEFIARNMREDRDSAEAAHHGLTGE